MSSLLLINRPRFRTDTQIQQGGAMDEYQNVKECAVLCVPRVLRKKVVFSPSCRLATGQVSGPSRHSTPHQTQRLQCIFFYSFSSSSSRCALFFIHCSIHATIRATFFSKSSIVFLSWSRSVNATVLVVTCKTCEFPRSIPGVVLSSRRRTRQGRTRLA